MHVRRTESRVGIWTHKLSLRLMVLFHAIGNRIQIRIGRVIGQGGVREGIVGPGT